MSAEGELTGDTIKTTIARTMTPFNKAVALRMWPESRQRASGLWLPEGARVRYDLAKCATIVDCGPGCSDEVAPLMDVLVAPFHDGVEIDIPGMGPDGEPGRFRIVGEKAIVARLSEMRPAEAILADIGRLVSQFNHANVENRRLLKLAWHDF